MAFVIWVPQLGGTLADAIQSSRLIDDPRSVHYWDQSDVSGIAFAQVLHIGEPAWDVYLAYAPGIRWEGTLPPRPSYWMQQLGLQSAPRLDGSLLADHVRALLHESEQT
jgi:hypothetical protein